MKKLIYLLILPVLFIAAVTSGCKNPILGLGPAADIDSPTGVIDTYVNGDYVRGQITLNGTSEDDVRIESVRAVLGTEVMEAALTRGDVTLWSVPIDTTSYPDGEYTLILTITDSVGRETEKRLLLYFDNTPPTVMITSDVGITSAASTNFPVIRGEAYDYKFSRIDHLEAEVVSGSAEITSLQGTNGWTLNLDTTGTGTGTCSVRITAFDSAGNSNDWLYHSSDFPSNPKIEDVANAEAETGTLGSLSLASIRRTAQDVKVDLSLDEPVVIISNPEEGKTAEQNIMGGTSVAVGYIEDDDEVDTNTIELSTDGGATWQKLGGAQLSGSGGFIRWNYDFSSFANGAYALQVRAADTGKPAGDTSLTGYSSVVPFTIDKTAPTVTVESPESGTYLSSGSFTISGTAEDTGGRVETIGVSVNSGAYENVSITSGERISWTHNITGVDPGAVDIRVEVVDNSGKTSRYTMQVYVDVEVPSVEFLSPTGDSYVNGTVTLQGVSSDNWSLNGLKLQVGGSAWEPATAEVLSSAEFYSWKRSIVTSDYENISSAREVNSTGVPQTGTGIWELKIWAEAEDRAGNKKLAEHRVYIDNSLDRPEVTIASPADETIFAGSALLSGSARDDQSEAGEDIDHIEVRIWKGQDAAGGGSSFSELFNLNTLLGLADVYGDGSWYRINGTSTWKIELNTGGEFYPNGIDHNGTVKIDVRAVDQKNGIADIAGDFKSRVVTFDETVPVITVIYPESGTYLSSGSFTISGTVEDLYGEVQAVKVSINEGAYTNVNITPGESVSWSHSVNNITPGAVSISVQAVDNSEKTSYYSSQVYVDVEAPSVEFLSPTVDSYVNGTVTLQGISSDNWSLNGLKLQIGGLAWDPAAAEVLSSTEFYSWQRSIITSDYENISSAREVNDFGVPQTGTGIWELKIWAEAVDRAGNATLAEHRVYIDNNLDRPQVTIASPADGTVFAGSVLLSGSATDDRNEAGEDIDHIEVRIWKGQDAAGGGSSFSELFNLDTLLGLADVYGDGSWYRINGTSTWQVELNTAGEFYPNGTDHNGTVRIDVRAVDQKGGGPDLAGNIETVQVAFDDTIPQFSNLSHASGDYERGAFELTGTVSDDESVTRLRISYDNGGTWSVIGTNLGKSSPFSHWINTADFITGSGILYLRLEAVDSAQYKTITSINLNIDNLVPTGTYTANITDLLGTAALVQGTAVDTGTVSGIDRIEVTFTLDGVSINPLNTKNVRAPIVIDSRTELGNDGSSNGDDDGFNESMSLSGSTWTWWAQFDTTSFNDGVLGIVYTIYDNAGNKYTETVTGGNIKNHAPEIISIKTGWDSNHDGTTTDPDEYRTYTVDTTESNAVYGNLSYAFAVAYDGVSYNGALSYGIRVRPVPAGSWTTVSSVTATGSTLDTRSAAVFTSGDGNYEIEFSVTDGKGYQSLLTLGISVENTDTVNPTMDFYELDASDAAAVKAGNSGHIEIEAGTRYLSGLIPFSGRAEDNQRIESIKMSINGGAAVTVAAWNTTTRRLEYTTGLPLETGTGFISDGGVLKHRAEWKYVWDSATLPVGNGTTVALMVTDASNRTHSQTHTYNVVPYISKIDTALSASYSGTLARSALGKYPVLVESAQSTYETITLHGWNIDSSAAGTTQVRLSSDTDALNGTTPVGTLLTHTNTQAGDNQLAVALNAAGSGYLTVLVNGVPSRNNINSNQQTYNQETSDVHQNLTDDRYISVWDATRIWRTITLANHAVYPSMTMSGDTPHFVYVNNSEGYGQAYYLAGTTNNLVIRNWDLFTYTAVDLNSAGEHAALVDVNVVNGNYGDYNAGNYGGIFTNFYYDVPDHGWGNYDFLDNGVWLENLVDTTGATTAVLNRYQYPDMKVSGNAASTDVFYSVYDTLTGRLIFRHFLVGTDNTITGGTGGQINNTGTPLYTNVGQQNRNGGWPNYNGDDRFANDGTVGGVTYQPGETPAGAQVVSTSANRYSAVGTVNGTAVLAYYDTSGSGKLVFKYNTTPDNEAGWSSGITIDSFVNAEYIDLAVDNAGHIHIAWYDSYNGDVKYAWIPNYNSAAVQLYTVDSYLIVGSKLTISVSDDNNRVPFIAYKGLGNSARVAWLNGTTMDDGASADRFTGSWEVQTIPDLISDTDSNRFNIGVDTAGLPVAGYTDDGLEYIRLLDELAN